MASDKSEQSVVVRQRSPLNGLNSTSRVTVQTTQPTLNRVSVGLLGVLQYAQAADEYQRASLRAELIGDAAKRQPIDSLRWFGDS